MKLDRQSINMDSVFVAVLVAPFVAAIMFVVLFGSYDMFSTMVLYGAFMYVAMVVLGGPALMLLRLFNWLSPIHFVLTGGLVGIVFGASATGFTLSVSAVGFAAGAILGATTWVVLYIFAKARVQ
jgi:hypothetical protein